jgi:hypothetical protein
MMDYLEWAQNHDQANPNNGRFGTNGMSLLANLSVDDPIWNEVAPNTTGEQRQQMIDAAKAALAPQNQAYLNEVHGGDGIFEQGDIDRWLNRCNEGNVSSQSIDTVVYQGPIEDGFVLSAILAAAATPSGQQAIQDAISQNPDGSYTVAFKGDTANPIVVTQADLDTYKHSSGDMDAAILEVAIAKYCELTGMNGGRIDQGGDGGDILALILGRQKATTILRTTPEQFANELRKVGSLVPMPEMVFSCPVGGDGRPSLTERNSQAFSVTNINVVNNTITFVNPCDTSKPITMSIDEFATYVDHM